MFTNMFNALARSFERTGSHHISPSRSRRTNRRYTFNEGIEGLEGRLAPSGGVAPVTVTVTNQTDPSTPTDPGDPGYPGDGSDSGVGTFAGAAPSQQQTIG